MKSALSAGKCEWSSVSVARDFRLNNKAKHANGVKQDRKK